MEAIEAIRERRMFRGRFQDKKVDEAVILQLIEAARWAPSGHNSQPWAFLVINDSQLIGELVIIAIDIMTQTQKTRSDLKDWVQIFYRWLRWSEVELESAGDGLYMNKMSRATWEKMRETDSIDDLRAMVLEEMPPNKGTSKITASPCLIFTLLDKTRKIPDTSQGVMELLSTGGAIQNFRIAAQALGLAVHELSMLCDLSQTRDRFAEKLGIPARCRIVSAMRVGYPGTLNTNLKSHVRRSPADLVHWNRF